MLDIGDDKVVEAVRLKPFGEAHKKDNILQVYESFCQKRMAFNMGSMVS